MTASADPAEVAAANRAGVLHASQRKILLDFNFWAAAVLALAGVATLVVVPIRSAPHGAGGGLAAMSMGAEFAALIPVLALACWFAWVCWRRLADVREGRLVTIGGWTHDYGHAQPGGRFPIELYMRYSRGHNAYYFLRAGGKEYDLLDHELRQRIEPERNNAVFLTARTRRMVNVLPA